VIVDERDLNRDGAEKEGDKAINDKLRQAHDDLVARLEEDVAQELDDLVGTVANHELSGGEPVGPGERLAQGEASPVGIELAVLKGVPGGGDRLGGRPEGVLVRGQLDDPLGSSPRSRATSSMGLPGT